MFAMAVNDNVQTKHTFADHIHALLIDTNPYLQWEYEMQLDEALSNGNKNVARQLRETIQNTKLFAMVRARALSIYVGAIMVDTRQQQIMLCKCLSEDSYELRFAAAAACADGWVEPTKSILKLLRQLQYEMTPVGNCARTVLNR